MLRWKHQGIASGVIGPRRLDHLGEFFRLRYSRRTGVLDLVVDRTGRILTVGRDRKVRLWSVDGAPRKVFWSDSSLAAADRTSSQWAVPFG